MPSTRCVASLVALTGLFAAVTFDADAMAAGADDPYLAATDLAELLVSRGHALP